MRRRLSPASYSLIWLVLVALIGLGAWFTLTSAPYKTLAPGELKRSIREVPEAPDTGDDFIAEDLTLRGAEITVSSDDGELRMRVYADLGTKRDNVYAIEQGAVQFTLKNQDTLLLRVNDATYRREAGLVTVRGTLTGYITEGQQFFQASELHWDEAQLLVTTQEVRYVGPSVEVRGEKMSIDLATGEVRFDGPVEVGV